jgi:hypothetical protein
MNLTTHARPTGTRHWLIVFAIALAIVQYIDRVCISQAMPDIALELNLSDTEKGAVFAAFGLAYALSRCPLVVVFHRRHWLGLELHFTLGHSISLRRG